MDKNKISLLISDYKNRAKKWLEEIFYTLLGLAGVVVMILIAGTVFGWLSDVFFDLSVAQEKFAKELQISNKDFLKTYCYYSKICSDYEDVRQSCATAGDIEGCIHIKMKGADYSSCFDGSIVGLPNELKPNKLQCLTY